MSICINFSNLWPYLVTKLEAHHLENHYFNTQLDTKDWPVTQGIVWIGFQKKL
jgi:hypothetical protein